MLLIFKTLRTCDIGERKVPAMYRNAAIFDTPIFSMKGENISKFNVAKKMQTQINCMFLTTFDVECIYYLFGKISSSPSFLSQSPPNGRKPPQSKKVHSPK